MIELSSPFSPSTPLSLPGRTNKRRRKKRSQNRRPQNAPINGLTKGAIGLSDCLFLSAPEPPGKTKTELTRVTDRKKNQLKKSGKGSVLSPRCSRPMWRLQCLGHFFFYFPRVLVAFPSPASQSRNFSFASRDSRWQKIRTSGLALLR